MNVLVTGGFGYLGGRLAQYFGTQGHRVILGSRQAAAPPAWLPGAAVAQTRWDSVAALREACHGADAVVHAAGMNAPDSAANPAQALAFSGGATATLVDAAISAGVRRFLYFSTAHVYCSPLTGVISEGTPPANPHPYATTHLAGERAVLAAGRSGRFEAVVVRVTNAFGAPSHPDVNCWMLLVNDLCRMAVVKGELVLRSSGRQERDFIAIPDVNLAVDLLLQVAPGRLGDGLYNVGSGRSMSVLDMARVIADRCEKVLAYRPAIRTNPHATDDSDGLAFRIDRLRQLGWMPGADLATEIDRTLTMCRDWSRAQ